MNPNIADKVLNYVAVNSALVKRAFDELSAHRKQQEKAAAERDSTLEVLIKAGCISADMRKEGAAILASPAETLKLLKKAADKIASQKTLLLKQASDNGVAIEDPTSQTAVKQAADSLNDPYVGRRSSKGQKASDAAMLSILGLPS